MVLIRRGIGEMALGRESEIPVRKSSIVHALTKRYVRVEEVPLLYQEKYIVFGYRQPCSSATDCIVSAFRLNNETFNIWSQIVPFFYLLHYFYSTFPSRLHPLSSIPTRYYPLIMLELGACGYLLGSTLAHTFNCMTPRIRHVCFYVDYVAISMFAFACCSTSFYYLRPVNTGFFLMDSPNLFLGGATICAASATFFAVKSRHTGESSKYILRTMSFAIIHIYANSLLLIRLLLCLIGEGEKCSHGFICYISIGWSVLIVCAFLNTTRFPESLFPGVFDTLGHNHQWMHVVAILGTVCQYWIAQDAFETRRDLMPVLLNGLNVYSSLGWFMAAFSLSSAIAMWFGCQLTTDGRLGPQKQ